MTEIEIVQLLNELDDKSRNGNLVERVSATLRLREEVLLNFETLLRLATYACEHLLPE